MILPGNPLMLNTTPDENPDHGAKFCAIQQIEHVSFLPNRRTDGKVANDLLLDCGNDGTHLLQCSTEKLSYSELNSIRQLMKQFYSLISIT